MTVTVPRESIEKFETDISSSIDPTANVVSFAFVRDNTSDRPTTWTPGAWTSGFADGKARAATPTVGIVGSGAEVELPAGIWDAFVKVVGNPEVPVRACGSIELA